MMKNHRKIIIAGILALMVALMAGVVSFALAQSGGDDQAANAAGKPDSLHADYEVSLEVTGDLSAVDPNLQGILPLNLTASGVTDIQKGDNGPQARGDVQLGGLDTIIQKITEQGSGNGQGAALGSLISGAVSNLQFVKTDGALYVNLAGSWYELGNPGGCHKHADGQGDANASGDDQGDENASTDDSASADDQSADNPSADDNDSGEPHGDMQKMHPDMESILPGGPRSLLTDVKQVGQEDIDGVSTTHTTATADVDKAITTAVTAMNAHGKADDAAQLEAARAQIEAAVKQLDLQWWIDGDGQLRQIKVAVEVTPSLLAPLAEGRDAKAQAALQGVTSVKLDATVKFSHFGEDFQITKPDGEIKSLTDLTGMAGLEFGHGHGHSGAGMDSAWRREKESQES